MSQKAHLTQKIKRLIAEIHLKHPDYGPKSLRDELLRQMKQSGLDLNFGPDWPGVSAVGKVLQEIRKKDESRTPESSGLDKPWSVASLAQYRVSAEALPYVLKAWVYYQENILDPPDYETRPFSIRIAQWVARLYRIYEKEDIKSLTEMAYLYAMDDQVTELADIDDKRIDLDILLYEIVTKEEILRNDERFGKIIRGLNLPVDYITKRKEAIRMEDGLYTEDDVSGR